MGLSDPNCSDENLGYIRLFIKIDRNDQTLSIEVVSFHFSFGLLLSAVVAQNDDEKSGKDLHGMDHTGNKLPLSSVQGGKKRARNSSLSAKSILTVTLLDGKDLPAMDDNGNN